MFSFSEAGFETSGFSTACSVPHFGVHLSRKDFDALKARLKERGVKYYDEPYLRFKGTKYEQETFFVKDPNENILEIKTLTANPE